MDNNIGIDANGDRRPTSATSVPTIVCCDPQKVKPNHGQYSRHKKKLKNLHRNIKNNNAPTSGTDKNTPTFFVNSHWASSSVNCVLWNIKLRLL